MKKYLKNLWKENKSLLVFISLMLVFRSAVADWNDVPTGSMQPTIVEGDRILINKLAYDINVPFIHTSLVKLADPKRNDIVIFESKVADKRLVKRVIGIPGDVITMKDNKLTINGKQLNYQITSNQTDRTIIDESFIENKHQIQITHNNPSSANFNAIAVPEDHFLVLGDNRNNSADSRFIGFVPRNEIIGRSEKVILSLDYENYFLPRSERFFIDI